MKFFDRIIDGFRPREAFSESEIKTTLESLFGTLAKEAKTMFETRYRGCESVSIGYDCSNLSCIVVACLKPHGDNTFDEHQITFIVDSPSNPQKITVRCGYYREREFDFRLEDRGKKKEDLDIYISDWRERIKDVIRNQIPAQEWQTQTRLFNKYDMAG